MKRETICWIKEKKNVQSAQVNKRSSYIQDYKWRNKNGDIVITTFPWNRKKSLWLYIGIQTKFESKLYRKML